MIERAILEATRELGARREPYLVATVVNVRGSAYRRPGARMIITRDGWVAGSVSGGCLESDVLRRAWWLTEQHPAVVTYDSSIAEDADADEIRAAFGLGCGGIVDILLERGPIDSGAARYEASPSIDPFAIADEWITAQRRGAIATVFTPLRDGGPGVMRVEHFAIDDDGAAREPPPSALRAAMVRAITTGDVSVLELDLGNHAAAGSPALALVEPIRPPPRLFVFGTGHDAVPVVRFARVLGWETIVCARHGRHGLHDRFREADEILIGDAEDRIDESDRAIALVMSHHVETDRDHLAMLLGTHVSYIGVLGAMTRTRRILDELGLDRAKYGIDPDPRIHAPVGLELGAESPEEIALSIVSEVQAVLARAPATHLRQHVGPIHARAS